VWGNALLLWGDGVIRKEFFFEKKKQKILLVWIRGPIRNRPRMPMSKSFLVLSFKKELLSLRSAQ
jgi:hypothetical protein